MTDEQYFAYPALSNSKLTEVKQEIDGLDSFVNNGNAFFFGSLFDAMITEPYRISERNQTFDGSKVESKLFDDALNKRKIFLKDDFCFNIVYNNNSEYQKVFIKDLNITYKGVDFVEKCKCKYDIFGTIGCDIKTTAATSYKSFFDACVRFDYFRSRAFYMDLSGHSQDVIIGISKTKNEIYKILITRGDDRYNTGKLEYERLAFSYHLLKDKFLKIQ